MYQLQIIIQDEDQHSAESVALAKGLLMTQYELLRHKEYLAQLFKVAQATHSKVKLDSFVVKTPSGVDTTGFNIIGELSGYAAKYLPSFTIKLTEKPFGVPVNPGIPIAKD